MSSWKVRPSRPGDLAEILELIRPFESPAFHWPEDIFRSEFASSQTWVLEEDHEIRAIACLRNAVEAWEISVVATKQEYQGQGLAAGLLKWLLDHLGQERQFWLEVHETNLAAQKLYRKLGFRNEGRRGGYYRDGSAALLLNWTRKNGPA
jgi:ribosomal-protein-alanine N-acetyltransferase